MKKTGKFYKGYFKMDFKQESWGSRGTREKRCTQVEILAFQGTVEESKP